MELEELLALLGYTGANTETKIEDVKKHFQEKFIGKAVAHEDKDIANKVYGKRLGSFETKMKSSFGFTKQDVEDKNVEDIFQMGFEAQSTKIVDLEKQLKETNTDEKVKTAVERADKAEKKLTQTNEVFKNLKTEFETHKKDGSKKLKNHFINNAKRDSISKLKLREDVKPLEKKGFEQHIKDKYEFDWEENDAEDKVGKLIVNQDGKQVTTDNKSDFATFDQILEKEAKEAGILTLNGTKKPDPKRKKVVTPDGDVPTRRLHPNAIKHEEKLNNV